MLRRTLLCAIKLFIIFAALHIDTLAKGGGWGEFESAQVYSVLITVDSVVMLPKAMKVASGVFRHHVRIL